MYAQNLGTLYTTRAACHKVSRGHRTAQAGAPSDRGMLNDFLDLGGLKDQAHPDGRPLSPRTARHIAFLIHDSLESAVRWGIPPANPMDRVVLPKVEKKEVLALDKQGSLGRVM